MCLHLAFLLIHKSEALAESKFKIHPLMNEFRRRYPCPRSFQIPAPRKMGIHSDGTKFFQNATVQKSRTPPPENGRSFAHEKVPCFKGNLHQTQPSMFRTYLLVLGRVYNSHFSNLPLLTHCTLDPPQTKPQKPYLR